MQGCDAFEEETRELLADERAGALDDPRYRELRRHAAGCAACGDLLELHRRLLAEGPPLAEPTAAELGALRQRLQVALTGRRPGEPGAAVLARGHRFGASRGLGGQPWLRPTLAAAAAVALLAGGFLAGRWQAGHGRAAGLRAAAGGFEPAFWLADPEGSPYRVSNVSLERRGADRVGLGFELSTHLEVERPSDDPLVRELLAHTLSSSSEPLGTRLRAVELGGEAADPKVRGALVFAMLDDPSQAVRLRALGALARRSAGAGDDLELRDALLEVLAGDDSVQMRLRAIDLLEGRGVEPERLRESLRGADPRRDAAVLVRAADLIDS